MNAIRLPNEPRTRRLPAEDELPYEDGEKVESTWHLLQMILLRETIVALLVDWYVGANMFLYYDKDGDKTRNFKGPDFFVVKNVPDPQRARLSWMTWNEGGKRPNVVIELLSETTRALDKGDKKLVYQNDLKVPEYFMFDPSGEMTGFRLIDGVYQPIKPNQRGRLISTELNLALCAWPGVYEQLDATWLRWETQDGQLLLTNSEKTELERKAKEQAIQRGEQERKAKEQAIQREELERAEKERLLAILKAHGLDPK